MIIIRRHHQNATRQAVRKKLRLEDGFALIVTVSLMILLTVIAVGLMTLGSISLRSTSQSSDMAIARSNARLAMMLALGELQKAAGPDTRVTARADILKDGNPAVLGVWKSWEGTDHDSSGRPIAPDYSNNKQTRFLAWLTSVSQGAGMGQVPDAKKGTDKIALLGDNTVGTADPSKRQVYLTPTKVTTGKTYGTYCWWIGGENQKARLPRPFAPATDSAAAWSVHSKSHTVADTTSFGLDTLLTDSSLRNPAAIAPANKAISQNEVDFLTTSGGTTRLSQDSFHDLSTTSMGLLTNTATGGWRKDFSLVSESWASMPPSGLPFFRVNPKQDLLFTRADGGSDPWVAKSLMYYWSDYRRGAAGTGFPPIYSFPAIGSWANLVNWATLYKNFTASSGTMIASTQATPINANDPGGISSYIHKVRIHPVIARVQWLYSHRTKPSAAAGKYDLYLVVQPVFTLWNPYNVAINALPADSSNKAMTFNLEGSLPPVIDYSVGGTALPQKVTLQNHRLTAATAGRNIKGAHPGRTTYTLDAKYSTAFAPGETKIYSGTAVFSNNGSESFAELTPGWTPGVGEEYLIAAGVGTSSSKISTAVSFDTEFNDGADGVGLYMNMNTAAGYMLAYRMIYDTASAGAFYPPKPASKFATTTCLDATAATQFLSVTFGARMASNTHLPSKGFVQSSPFVFYTAMGKKATVEGTIAFQYPGTLHNVNSPFEYSFQEVTGNSNPYTPPSGLKGYIVTGFQADKGLTRCVIDELPGRPVNSLAELQNWDARYENPIPPYCFNLVGNSDATPLLPSNAVYNSGNSSKGNQDLQHDDSYCLNHVLFDDWFCSSIAPEPANFGAAPSTSSIRKVYVDCLTVPSKPLYNRAYKPLPEDVATALSSAANANALATKNVGTPATSWKTIASRLEVEGMFNVNSTSVKAWRALLGHARNQRIPYMGSTGSPSLSEECDYAANRFSVAGDVESSKAGTSGTFANCAQYAGYRVFSKDQLDALATEIVNQVRARGPFLSLSEFVNRQLSTNDMAAAGAIQTALNVLAADASKNPYKLIQQDPNVSQATASPPGAPTGYQYPAAAVGYNVYGLPGWTRQADILRPLAPILSARDDTFVIRTYGDSRDASGKIIKARAYCEATVRRVRDYVDSTDDAAVLSSSTGAMPDLKAANAYFGRRFTIVSFRWLSPNEI